MMTCPSCGLPCRPGTKFCEECGALVQPDKKFCGTCGTRLIATELGIRPLEERCRQSLSRPPAQDPGFRP